MRNMVIYKLFIIYKLICSSYKEFYNRQTGRSFKKITGERCKEWVKRSRNNSNRFLKSHFTAHLVNHNNNFYLDTGAELFEISD